MRSQLSLRGAGSRASGNRRKTVPIVAAAAALGLGQHCASVFAAPTVYFVGQTSGSAADNNFDDASADTNFNTTDAQPGNTNYADGDAVIFTDQYGGPSTALTTITVNAPAAGGTAIAPASVTFEAVTGGSAATAFYQITDGTATAGIGGTGSLTLASGFEGEVQLNNANSYSGGTFVNGGILHSGTGSLPSTTTVTLGGGTFQGTSSSTSNSYTATQNFVVTGGSSGTFAAPGNSTFVDGTMSSTSAATLNFTGPDGVYLTPTTAVNTMSGFTGTVNLGATGLVHLNPFSISTVEGSTSTLFNLGTTTGNTGTLNSYNVTGAVVLGALEGNSTTTLGGNAHVTGTYNYNSQQEFAVGGAGLSTVFDGVVSGGNVRANLVINGGGSLTLSNANTYTSRQSTGATPSGYQGPGTWVLGQGQAIPSLSALAATMTGQPTSSTGGVLYVSNTSGSGTGPSPVLVEGATTNTGLGATFGGNGTVASYVTTVPGDVGETNVAAYGTTFAAGPTLSANTTSTSAGGTTTGTVLTLTGGLHAGDYTNFDFTVGTTSTSMAVSNTSDPTLVTTALTLPTDGLIQVNFTDTGTVALNSPYTLITYTGTDVDGSLGSWSSTGVPNGDAVSFADTGSAITATFSTSVPEPASLSLVGLGSALVLRRRRRQPATRA